MKREKNIKSYTAAELKARRAHSRTDLDRVDAQRDAELERLVAEDEDERGISATGPGQNWFCHKPSNK